MREWQRNEGTKLTFAVVSKKSTEARARVVCHKIVAASILARRSLTLIMRNLGVQIQNAFAFSDGRVQRTHIVDVRPAKGSREACCALAAEIIDKIDTMGAIFTRAWNTVVDL
jgi:hypothetical protein